ncbi:cytochrome d ubiquinol oxidase subunit II [Thalassobaculum sp.]|uniref:cytochrome d ubiquinol oxidase subunit II n=1 Tax=Thalassobaculum sp. TaxID=2022740 RepID=UPI0032EF1C45
MFESFTDATGLALWLPLASAGVVGFAVAMYVLMDGFDLGVGILFPGAAKPEWRDAMMVSVAPVWDGNETWLVLGGAGLFALFPVAYATLLPAFYLPLTAMLLALILRGVAFEFRFKTEAHKPFWSASFHLGSVVATFTQGLVLGAFVEGKAIEAGAGHWAWLSPFSVFVGLALLVGYGLLGATWIVKKTEGEMQAWARDVAGRLVAVVAVALVIVSLWMPVMAPEIAARWFAWPNMVLLAPVPIAAGVLCVAIFVSLRRGGESLPFYGSFALFLSGYAGLAVSLFPALVPGRYDIWQAASGPSSLAFALVGLGVLIPMILGYTLYNYYVFRGKVRLEDVDGYH